MIEIKNVTKSFDKTKVLSDICFTIPEGNITCFLGPSGSGKTTLIRLIMGSLKPDCGEIRVNNFSVPNSKILPQIGFMPQNDALYHDLSGIDNIYFFGRLHNMPKKVLRERTEQVLDIVNLTFEKNKLVRKFSHGMKKRLSLAIAILNNPKIILLDEPTSGIDPLHRRSIWQKLVRYRDSGCTIIVTTHIMDEVLECDLAALIFEGEVIAYDKVKNLLASTESGKIEELFLKNAAKT
jgi:ABC-2 type transport system ATP-binding protein